MTQTQQKQILFMEETQTLNADNMQLSNADDSMKKIRLPSEGSLVIGRDPEADVFINHPSLSWHHAKLIVRSGTWVLVDLSSTNGTFVDGQRVTKVEVIGIQLDSIGRGIFGAQ